MIKYAWIKQALAAAAIAVLTCAIAGYAQSKTASAEFCALVYLLALIAMEIQNIGSLLKAPSGVKSDDILAAIPEEEEFAVLYYPKRGGAPGNWAVHIGNSVTPFCTLGDVSGDGVGYGGTLKEAMTKATIEFQKSRAERDNYQH